MTDYCSNLGSSSSSDIASLRRVNGGIGISSGISSNSNTRIRVARLVRPQSSNRRIVLGQGTTLFGFAIRGGREFGTGFFISNIEKGSQADLKGLKIGDQIIRVNGYHVDDAVHRELSQYIGNQDRVTLKVRGVGMIPVKERSSDSLTWHIVSGKQLSSNLNTIEYNTPSTQQTTQLPSSTTNHNDIIAVTLSVPPRTKLGLGICKGPEWKSGIFVQFTKEYGVAQEAGLRPGDQLLSCNRISFADISFSDAVAAMKSSFILELLVRPGAGLELFPGESSGYNSSASSITEEQIPSWITAELKNQNRLSNMKENNERLDNFRTKIKSIAPPRVPHRSATTTLSTTSASSSASADQKQNTTIIKLSDAGTVINNTLIPTLNDDRTNCSVVRVDPMVSHNHHHNHPPAPPLPVSELKTVRVDVHRNGVSKMDGIPPPPPTNQFMNGGANKTRASISSSTSIESGEVSSSSLSSAISQAVKLRAARNQNGEINFEQKLAENGLLKSKILGNSMADKNMEKHNALMDEFKKAHRRMFKNGIGDESDVGERQSNINGNGGKFSNGHYQQQHTSSSSTDEPDRILQKNTIRNKIDLVESTLTSANGNGIPVKKSPQNILFTNNYDPPLTPTPDYDSTPSNTMNNRSNGMKMIVMNGNGSVAKGTMGRVAASEIAKANGAAAEMESIESFKLTNPSSPVPKPPPIYFAPQTNGPATMKKTQRAVSVTIGEYGNLKDKKEPTKFDFIKSNSQDYTGYNSGSSSEDVAFQLRDELEKTLSRSNLKKQNGGEVITTTNGNGLVTFSNSNNNNNNSNAMNNNNIPKKLVLQKTQSANIEKLSSMLNQHHLRNENGHGNGTALNGGVGVPENNKITISIHQTPDVLNGKMDLKKFDSTPLNLPNGILKTSATNIKITNGVSNGNGYPYHHPEPKNIKFENM